MISENVFTLLSEFLLWSIWQERSRREWRIEQGTFVVVGRLFGMTGKGKI
jgi:hypothetical protein